MNKNLKVIAIAASILIPSLVNGQSTCQVAADIYFINGVNKPVDKDVKKDALILEKRIKKYSHEFTNIRKVDYLYNESDGLMLDTLYEFAAQKAAERNGAVADFFLSVGFSAFGLFSPLSDADKLEVRRLVAGVITKSLPVKTQDLVSKFSVRVANESLTLGHQAVLVPHSQGNMFANSVYDSLRLSLPANIFRGLGVVGVASPASWAPSGLYVTSFQDEAINVLAANQTLFGLTLPPLAANFDASLSSLLLEPWGHGFAEVYLAQNLPSGTTAVNSIAAAVVSKVDSALYRTSTFLDSPAFIWINGVKVPRPSWYQADSTSVTVCFPGAVGGA